MSVGDRERITQNRIVGLFRDKLHYTYLGDHTEYDNTNIEEDKLRAFLKKKGYSTELIRRAINSLVAASQLTDTKAANKAVYMLLRYGSSERENVTVQSQTVQFIDWKEPFENDFYIAEEVTVSGNHDKRPDIVLYINGIAVTVLELKRSTVSVSEGIRQNLDNQSDEFIRPFFSTIQLIMAGNDTEGLRYGVFETPAKFYMQWTEEDADRTTDDLSARIRELSENEGYKVDRHLISLCQQERLLDLIYNFIVFDGGIKKICRHNQYFGVLASRQRVTAGEGGIVWHTQGSGKSLTMVWLSRWIKENFDNARVLIVTDRDELDEQIETKVFGEAGSGDSIYRTKSCADLIDKVGNSTPRMMCSLIHKFGRHGATDEEKAYDDYIEELKHTLPPNFKPQGDFFVFVDECHRTQSGKLHDAMEAIIPNAVFIGFTGTPLLSRKEMRKRGIKSSIEIFGTYIHTYKYPEAVADKVVLDLLYEARDVDQWISSSSQGKIDEWFEAKTSGLTDLAKAQLKRRWGTLKEVYSSRDRLAKIVTDIIYDMEVRDRLVSGKGNAILVADDIYTACRYYKLFLDNGFDKCAIITSFSGDISEIKGEATGEARATEARFKYDIYQRMLGGKDVKTFETDAKDMFINEPYNMRLLIVVDKLLTGFDAPSATYLYIDQKMSDHRLFQAICRVNRLDDESKEYGYVIDYRDLFQCLESAVKDYTSGAFDAFEPDDVKNLIKTRTEEAETELITYLETLRALCEPVEAPRSTLEFIRYFVWKNDGDLDELDENKPKRLTLYTQTASLIRTFADVAGNLSEMGYSDADIEKIRRDVDCYNKIRDEIKLASGDYIDLKTYEADMRHLIDNYIGASDSEVISKMSDMTLIELIVEKGVDFVEDLPDGIKGNEEAVAETIEQNVRKKIIEKQSQNPLYYSKMSELLMQIIADRKAKKISYKEYLEKIVEASKMVAKPEEYSNYPDEIKHSSAMRALYDNIADITPEFIVELHVFILRTKPDNWKGDKAKTRALRRSIRCKVNTDAEEEVIFEIVEKQREYY
ncbi:MAG: HsdR family type I site-specific deoxyribonuclease [Sphaerochaetaceae bacterium]|nr:HsdR family type I site-specific deoxyribonuclease [Sphaerochaetaceae bacterium]